jgi:hypothetical protein
MAFEDILNDSGRVEFVTFSVLFFYQGKKTRVLREPHKERQQVKVQFGISGFVVRAVHRSHNNSIAPA